MSWNHFFISDQASIKTQQLVFNFNQKKVYTEPPEIIETLLILTSFMFAKWNGAHKFNSLLQIPTLPSWDYRMLSPLSAEEGNQKAPQATGSLLLQSIPSQPPCLDHPVMCLLATFSSMQTQTGAFKVILWLVFLEASVSTVFFWWAKWLKKFSPGAHCEMPTDVRFCFAFQTQMPLPE